MNPLPKPHDAVLLLPWYLNGTLEESERRELEAHLAQCETCRQELAELEQFRDQYRFATAAAPGPGARVRQAVFSQIEPRSAGASLAEQIGALGRLLFRPAWAPACPTITSAASAGALGWFVFRSPPTSTLGVRDVSRNPTRLRILFNPTATQQEVVGALRELGARVEDGPDEQGAYVVEISAGSPREIAVRIRAVQQHSGLIQAIGTAAP